MPRYITVPHLHIRYLDPESVTISDAQDIYLDWTNNFLTASKFAEHYGVTQAQAESLIDHGREIHEQYVQMIKNLRSLHDPDDLARNQ